MDKRIWIVSGITGEYSDRREWLVKAFTDERSAKNFVDRLSALSREQFEKAQKLESFWDYEPDMPLDPKFEMDYSGTIYVYDETELDDGT